MRRPLEGYNFSDGTPDVSVSYPHPVTGMATVNDPSWTEHFFISCDYCGETIWGFDGASASVCELGLKADGWTTVWVNAVEGATEDRCPTCNGHPEVFSE